jgi:hypothetical protein
MNNTIKTGLALASALAAVVSAQAGQYVNGDLLVGFDGGSSDYIFNLGSVSSLYQGETWTVGSSLGNNFGVIGSLSSAAGKFTSTTSYDSALNESGLNSANTWASALTGIKTLAGGTSAITAGQSRTVVSSDQTSWTFITDQAAGSPGSTLFFNTIGNPNVPTSGTAYFWELSNDGTITGKSYFTYDSASGVLTYGVAIVPEPTSLGLLGVAGLVVIARRKGAKA